jgi:acyl dehydratase
VSADRLRSAADVHAAAGVATYRSDWVEIDQARVNRFADATGDHQWIHVDPERARREAPFGAAIAHGFLTLALVPMWLAQCVPLETRMSVNYGLNRVRFMAPVRVGSSLRATFAADTVIDVDDGAVQVVWLVTVEVRESEKPACVAEFVTRHYF